MPELKVACLERRARAIRATGLILTVLFAQASYATSEDISLLSYNIWGRTVGGREHGRYAEIGRAIRHHDIVAIQEAWHERTRELAEASELEYVVRGKRPGKMVGASGLLTLSRYPVIESESLTYQDCAGVDCLADKGVLRTRVRFPDGYTMDVYNTHLNAWASIGIDLGEIARGKQIRQLGKLIATRSVALGIPYVVLGDFNAKEDSKNYPQMEAAFRALDAFRAFRPHDPGHTWDPANSWVPDFLALARIDYIWTSSLAAIDVLDSTVEFSEPNSDGKHLSDHYGVSARIARPQPGF